MTSPYIDVDHVVHFSTNKSATCEECNSGDTTNGLAIAINHYMSLHGYVLLHVGTETGGTGEQLYHDTAAVLGRPRKPRTP